MPVATQHFPCRRSRPHAGQQVVFFSRQHGIFLCNLNFEFWNESDFRFRILATDLLVPSIAPPAPPDIDEEISKRDDERVSLLPIEALVTNIARTAAAKGMVDDCARVPMRLGFFARAEKLKSALNGRHGGAVCHWVAKLQNISVKSIR